MKQIIYFLIMLVGGLFMAFQNSFETKEYGLIIGIIFLMFGLYKMSTSWKENNDNDNVKDSENEF